MSHLQYCAKMILHHAVSLVYIGIFVECGLLEFPILYLLLACDDFIKEVLLDVQRQGLQVLCVKDGLLFHDSLFQALQILIIRAAHNGAVHDLLDDGIHDIQGDDEPFLRLMPIPFVINDLYMKLDRLQHLMHQVFKLLQYPLGTLSRHIHPS